ncbi:MAG: hypothetical protein IIC20_02910 [Chloroflexi bacterium]|nr:hypothetical protein [Chloroflexota bacterium]
MPRRSKQIAARQAALAKKKKKTGPRPAIIFRPQESTTVTQAEVVATPPPVRPSAETPDFEVPVRARPAPASAPAAAAAPRGALPASPYLISDLKRIGRLAAVLMVVLIVLTFVIG